jgi:hypothetical protein
MHSVQQVNMTIAMRAACERSMSIQKGKAGSAGQLLRHLDPQWTSASNQKVGKAEDATQLSRLRSVPISKSRVELSASEIRRGRRGRGFIGSDLPVGLFSVESFTKK